MAGPESIDQTFNRENYTRTGIRNAQVIRGEERPVRDKKRQAARAFIRQQAIAQNTEELRDLSRAEQVALQTSLAIRAQAQNNKKTGLFGKVQKNVARVRVISVASTVAIWAIPLYLTMILPIGLLATGMFGIAAGLWALFGMTSDGTTVESILGFAGIGIAGQLASTFIGLFFIASAIVCFMNAVIILGASAEFKIAFIKPWFGSAAALKIICIILALICSFLPLVQLAPLALLWVAVVFFYPK